jgi:hypothetical protein
MAVAILDHQPDANGLLQARLARGWRPTPSQLKEGERVLGYAACVVKDAWTRIQASGSDGTA